MSQVLKPYPAYKDSGLPWLGKVPQHWAMERLKARAANIIDQTDERRRGELYVALEHVESWSGRLRDAGSDVVFESQVKRFRTDDVLFGKLRPYLAKVTRPPRDGVCVSEFFVLRPRGPGLSAGYLEHLLRSKPIIEAINSSTFGAKMPRADWQFVGSIVLPFPSIVEQSAIVRFLDHADRRIRRYIAAKKKLIALLSEQKLAIIHRVITLGLDRAVSLKPSGISGLGGIPQHWDTPLNQRVFKEEIRPHGGLPETQLSLSQRDGLIATSDMKERSLQTSTYDNWKITLPGDLVLNRFKAHLGVFFAATMRGIVSFHYGVFAPRQPLHTKYFELLFHTYPYRAIYAGRSNGMTVGLQNLSNQNFYSVRCVVPPFSEQVAIVEHIDSEAKWLNAAIAHVEREIELIHEYHSRLVSDVVLGKLDVREAVRSIPDKLDEPEITGDIDTEPDELAAVDDD